MKIWGLILLLFAVGMHCSVFAKVFEDQFGRLINAELVSHTGATGENVTIKKSGKEIQVKVALFSEIHQKFIRAWMKETPPKLDYNFRVEVVKKDVETKPSASPFNTGANKMAFLIRVTNLTRQPVSGIRVEYRAYMKDYGGDSGGDSGGDGGDGNDGGEESNPGGFSDKQVEEYLRRRFGRGRGRGRSSENSRKPQITHTEESREIEEVLKFNESATLETRPMRIDSGKVRWSSERYKDELIGVIVRVFEPGGEMVYEYRDHKTADYIWAESSGPVRGFTEENAEVPFQDLGYDKLPVRGFTEE